jgi:hypothetical protein
VVTVEEAGSAEGGARGLDLEDEDFSAGASPEVFGAASRSMAPTSEHNDIKLKHKTTLLPPNQINAFTLSIARLLMLHSGNHIVDY